MLCRKPFGLGTAQGFPCGQCMPCRINRRRLWTHRLLLEQTQHAASSFVTLTYSEETIPVDGSLNPPDLTNYLKRLRKLVEPVGIRYFGVGEYGDDTFRPHYHLALFGLGLEHEDYIKAAWSLDGEPLGHVLVGELTEQSAAYVAGYVTKKMTSYEDPRLGGKHPEFARMSLRPGIGAGVVPAVADGLTSALGSKEVVRLGDVPLSLGSGRKQRPLGRYLRGKLRDACGFAESGQPQAAMDRQAAELRLMSEALGTVAALEQAKKFPEEGRILSLEKRSKMFNMKGKL